MVNHPDIVVDKFQAHVVVIDIELPSDSFHQEEGTREDRKVSRVDGRNEKMRKVKW